MAPTERKVSGGHGGGETPVPIPNTAVKPARADGTWGEAPWESRSPPGFLLTRSPLSFGSRGFRTFWAASRFHGPTACTDQQWESADAAATTRTPWRVGDCGRSSLRPECPRPGHVESPDASEFLPAESSRLVGPSVGRRVRRDPAACRGVGVARACPPPGAAEAGVRRAGGQSAGGSGSGGGAARHRPSPAARGVGPGSSGRSRTGTGTSSRARRGAAPQRSSGKSAGQTGRPRSAAARPDGPRSGPARPGAPRPGAKRTGAPGAGAPRSGAARSGPPRTGAPRRPSTSPRRAPRDSRPGSDRARDRAAFCAKRAPLPRKAAGWGNVARRGAHQVSQRDGEERTRDDSDERERERHGVRRSASPSRTGHGTTVPASGRHVDACHHAQRQGTPGGRKQHPPTRSSSIPSGRSPGCRRSMPCPPRSPPTSATPPTSLCPATGAPGRSGRVGLRRRRARALPRCAAGHQARGRRSAGSGRRA